MRITGLKTFVANVSRTNFVFVKLYTDEGIAGVGEATLEWKTLAVVAALEELERQLVGRNPFQSDALVEQLHRDSYWRTGAVFRTALGAVEAAMLDIKGKALGVPAFELLGLRYARSRRSPKPPRDRACPLSSPEVLLCRVVLAGPSRPSELGPGVDPLAAELP